jgi:hypothetical protein
MPFLLLLCVRVLRADKIQEVGLWFRFCPEKFDFVCCSKVFERLQRCDFFWLAPPYAPMSYYFADFAAIFFSCLP